MISVIIPSYRNVPYLQLCIDAILSNQSQKNEIVVVVDGFVNEYSQLIGAYTQVKWLWLDENQGLPMATNVGVYNSSSERILIINEDNIVPKNWDKYLNAAWEPNTVYAVQQIEPTPSIFKFIHADFGSCPADFKMELFNEYEHVHKENRMSDDAYTLPIFMSKKWFMAVGGWDVSFISPFVVDLDFFLKLQLMWTLEFRRIHSCSFYHFGSRSTKKRPDDSRDWIGEERVAAEQFNYKWGMYPRRLPNNRIFMDGLRGVSA